MSMSEGPWIPDLTVAGLLSQDPADRTYARLDDSTVSLSEIRDRVEQAASAFAARGVGLDSKVLTMLGNGLDHIILVLALCRIGAVIVPMNPTARGPGLKHVLETVHPDLILADDECLPAIAEAGWPDSNVLARSSAAYSALLDDRHHPPAPTPAIDPDDMRVILFTSGTTGPPKGVMVSERMIMASAMATGMASKVEDGDVFLMWEPLYHIGGVQMCVLALMREISLVIIPRFSASQFWPQIRAHNVNKLHYLGGVIDILLRQPPQADDRNHSVTHGFGAGCRADAQHAFQDRFNIPLHELYGMTEASSFTTVNAAGVPGSIGLPLPWFEILLLDKDGVSVPNGEAGELVTVERQPGLITAGYYQNPDATSAAIRGERLHTGDLMRRDDAGNLYFLGRMTQSIRRRGENISSWEVEQALVLHPAIVECAVIGVDAEIGEQEIHAFMRIMSGQEASPPDIAHWCKTYMPPHHVPRYFTILDDFPRTPSLRIKRDGLADLTAEVWDREE